MKYLITGGTGFLGSYVAKNLLERGDNVVCYGRSQPSTNSMGEVLSQKQIDSLVYAEGDVTDALRLIHVCQREKIDGIIHLAGLLLADSQNNVSRAIHTNILGTINCFEAAMICGIGRVVWASSNAAVGTAAGRPYEYLPNDAPHNPTNLYGKIKDFNEFIGEFYYNQYGLETIGLRYSVIYGKGRRRGGANHIKFLLNDPALGIPSVVVNGDDTPNFVYVEDAARGTLLALDAPYKRGAYNITGEPIALKDLREYVLKIFPNAKIEMLPGTLDIASKFDLAIESAEIGYAPEYGIKKGAIITINNVRIGAGLSPIEEQA